MGRGVIVAALLPLRRSPGVCHAVARRVGGECAVRTNLCRGRLARQPIRLSGHCDTGRGTCTSLPADFGPRLAALHLGRGLSLLVVPLFSLASRASQQAMWAGEECALKGGAVLMGRHGVLGVGRGSIFSHAYLTGHLRGEGFVK